MNLMYNLPIIDLTPDDIKDLSNGIKKLKNNLCKGRETFRSKFGGSLYQEEKTASKEYYKELWYKNNIKKPIDSFDFTSIKDDQYKETFKQLQKDYDAEMYARKNYINKCKQDNIRPTHKFYCPVASWTKSVQETYKYELINEYIEYNKDHYALWNEDRIYILNDYRVYDKSGNISRHMKPRSAKKAMKRYCKLFFNMLPNSSFEYYLWSIIEFCRQTIELNMFFLSPMDIYMEADKVFNSKSRKEKKVAPLLNVRRHKRLYLEPGFQKEARDAYAIYTKKKENEKILNYLKTVRTDEIDIKMIAMAVGQYKIEKQEWVEVENEFGVFKEGKSILKVVDERKLRKQINELIKANPELKDKFIKRKVQDKTVRKVQDKTVRKVQDRSKWHSLVKEGKSFKEVLKEYPNVSYSSYKTVKHRMNTLLMNE